MQIKFTRDYTVKDHEGDTFVAGQIFDMREDSARHFISRGVAVEVKARARKKTVAPARRDPT